MSAARCFSFGTLAVALALGSVSFVGCGDDGGGAGGGTGGGAGGGAGGGTGGGAGGGAGGGTGGGTGAVCGDGIVDVGESCDTGVGGDAGVGGCPTDCAPSGDACMPNVLQGEDCQAACVQITVVSPIDGDGCCPTDATQATDSDCATVCGDGVVTGAEACDTAISSGPGACPASCTGADACNPSVLTGTGCAATCVVTPIVAPSNGDSCCPSGADATNDDDCNAICGNAVVEPGESCEGASCPTACTPTDACSPVTLVGSTLTCDAACEADTISACIDDDGCCPGTCNSSSDNDCSASCGDGVLDSGEACDSGIATGPGSCPSSCSDGDVCTSNVLTGSAGSCTAACSFPTITDFVADGCCPAGGNNNNDADCAAVCGNDVTESGEKCDASCPTSCTPSGDACSPTVLTGTACTSECVQQPITSPTDGDGCCVGGDWSADNDCPGVCGNAVTEGPGETCDDNNPYDFDGCTECSTTDPETTCVELAASERGETGVCIECMCAGTAGDATCRDELDLCYNSTDVATGGPAAGTAKSVLCEAVVTCGRTSGCTGTYCYLGEGGIVSPDGPCKTEIQRAAETTSLLTILGRQTNLDYAVGRANAVGECATSNCSTECL